MLTFQVGGECSLQEARAEVPALTPHTTSRVFLGPAPPPSSKHSWLIPGRKAMFQGEVCKKLKSKWEWAKRIHVYPQKVGLSLRANRASKQLWRAGLTDPTWKGIQA